MHQLAIGSTTPLVSLVDGNAVTTSTELARVFGKPHHRVLEAIRALLPNLPPEHAPNFREMLQAIEIGNGATRQDPAYHLTRDGFTLLAMGFTGKKALQFKLAYIAAFNAMEAKLHGTAIDHSAARAQALSVGMRAEQEMCKAIMSGNSGQRVMCWLNHKGEADAKAIPDDASVLSFSELAKGLGDGDIGIGATNAELLAIAHACIGRLQHREAARARNASIQARKAA